MWGCKHGTFSSVVLSNITNAGKCDCSDLHPSISFGKEEHTKKTRQTEDKLGRNHTLKESGLFSSLSAAFLARPAKMWVMQDREVCATQWALLGAVPTQV